MVCGLQKKSPQAKRTTAGKEYRKSALFTFRGLLTKGGKEALDCGTARGRNTL